MSSPENLFQERYEGIFPLGSSSLQWSVTISLLSIAIASIFYFYRSIKPKELPSRIPGPSVNGLITNVIPLISIFRNKAASKRTLFFQVVCGYSVVFRKYGMWLFYGGFKKILILYKAETVEPVLSSSEILSKGFEYDFVNPLLKGGLLASKREKWRYRRKLLTPAFHFRILDEYIPIFNEQAKIFANKIDSLIGKGPWFDITPLTSLCTLDIICETAMGKKIHAQDSESPYVKALHIFCTMAVERIMSPWLWADFIYYRTKEGKAFKNALKIMDDFTRQVIRERKEENLKASKNLKDPEEADDGMNRKSRRRLALLDLLLDVHLKEETFTLEDVAEEVDNFMFAGHDTTSSGISWACYMLGLHPELQKKAQQEVDDVLGDDETRPITLDDIKELKYLDCVLKETRRLWPPTPFIARDLDDDTIIDGYLIPKGTSCGILIYMLHRDPDVFPNPEVFDPDRFLLENSVGRHPFSYVPFSAGPRNCIGQRFATFEAITVMAALLRKFDMKALDPLDQVHVVDDLILRAEKGLRMSFQLRKKSETP